MRATLTGLLAATLIMTACSGGSTPPNPTAAPAGKPAADPTKPAAAAPAAPAASPAAAGKPGEAAAPAGKPAASPAAAGAAGLPTGTSQVASADELGKLAEGYPRPQQASKPYKIGISIANVASGGTHFAGQLYGYLDEAKALGVEAVWVDAGGYANVAKQIDQIEDLVANKADAIIIVATNGPGTRKIVDEVVAKGIPVINVNVMTDSEAVATRIRSDDEVLGRLQAEFLKKQRGDKETNILMMPGAPGTSWAVGRAKGYKDALKDMPNYKILAEQYVENSMPLALKLAEDYIQTFPNFDAVQCGGDTQCIGMAQSLRAANKAEGKILTTADFQPDGEKMVRSGQIHYTAIQAPVILGRWGIRAAVNKLEGREVPKEIFSPIGEVTPQNVDRVDLAVVRAPADFKP